jgi:ribosomal protein S18 acetylase RimI-like enzyme
MVPKAGPVLDYRGSAPDGVVGESVSRVEGTVAQIESVGSDQAPGLVREFEPETCEQPLTYERVTEADTAAWDEAERFVYSVYVEVGFAEVSPRQWVEEIERFRHGSTLTVARDPQTPSRDIVGSVRTIFGPYADLPIGQFRTSSPPPTGVFCEISSLAVRRDVRGLGVVNDLHRAAVHHAMESSAEGFCVLVEPWSMDFFRNVYGVPLVQAAPARHYMGSLTVPAFVTFESMLQHFLEERPGMYRWVTRGLAPDVFEAYDVPILLD